MSAVIASVFAALGGGLLGAAVYLAWWRARARPEITTEELAERADVNGCRLMAMARAMECAARKAGLQAEEAAALREWAAECRRMAVEHLECINAIRLDSLAAVHDGPVPLGDWRRPDSEKRVEPRVMRDWGDAAARDAFVHRNGHTGPVMPGQPR